MGRRGYVSDPFGLPPLFVRAIRVNRLRIARSKPIDGTAATDIKPLLRYW
jgi:hypothetical protein